MRDIFVCKSENEFIPGLKLNKGFYFDIIKPLTMFGIPDYKFF